MAAAFAFLGMLLISTVVALLAALQLGDFFGANDEFILVIAGISGFAVVALAVFAIGYALARSAHVLTGIALLLALPTLAPVFLPDVIQRIADRSTNPYTVGVENTYITLEIVIPALLTVLVQWGLVRRRWLRTAGDEDLTLWPWVATAVAGLVLLNPIGLAIIQAAFKHSASDFLWQLSATVTAVAVGALVVMALIECYIRVRILRRRREANPPLSDDATPS